MILDLADGRGLDLLVTGPTDGVPVVFHHGTPGAVPQFGVMARAVHARGLRLVSFSRAGYGRSTRRAGRTVADVAADVTAILDHLAADRCVVAGWSGGGPHALACGALLPDRVAGVLSLASIAPYDADGLDFLAGMGAQNVVEFGLALQGEDELRILAQRDQADLRDADAEQIITALASLLPDVDRAALSAEFGSDTAANFAEAFRIGPDGWIDDDLAFVAPWGFQVDEIQVPTFVWQGGADLMVPFAHGRWLAERLPNVTVHLLPEEGHLSVVENEVETMLDELVATL